MAVKPIPDGFSSLTPYFVVKNVKEFITFIERALGARVDACSTTPDGKIMHANAKIGDAMMMMGEPHAECPPAPMMMYMYSADTDAAYRRAVAAGATSIQEPVDMFYGDRNAGVKDSWGNQWWFGTHIEDVSGEELARRAQAHGKG